MHMASPNILPRFEIRKAFSLKTLINTQRAVQKIEFPIQLHKTAIDELVESKNKNPSKIHFLTTLYGEN